MTNDVEHVRVPRAPRNAVTLPGQSGHNFRRVSALVVEKTELMRETLVGVLRTLGMGSVRAAGTPGYAFELFTAEPPDLVFTDWSPGFDGLDFLKTLRQHPETPHPFVPVIMVSANTEPRHICEARDSGVNEYVAKPFTAKRVYSHLAAVVEKHRNFIRTADFFGPDRRRRKVDIGIPDRRAAAA